MIGQIEQIPTGRAGLERKVAKIRALVETAKRDPDFRQSTVNLLRHVKERDWSSEIKTVVRFVQRIRFTRDPYAPGGLELFVDPRIMIRLVQEGQAAGDCDDHVLLAAAMLETIGHKVRYRVGGSGGENYMHIWIEVMHPKKGWVPAELIRDEVPIGYDPGQLFQKTETYPQQVGGLGFIGPAISALYSLVTTAYSSGQASGQRKSEQQEQAAYDAELALYTKEYSTRTGKQTLKQLHTYFTKDPRSERISQFLGAKTRRAVTAYLRRKTSWAEQNTPTKAEAGLMGNQYSIEPQPGGGVSRARRVHTYEPRYYGYLPSDFMRSLAKSERYGGVTTEEMRGDGLGWVGAAIAAVAAVGTTVYSVESQRRMQKRNIRAQREAAQADVPYYGQTPQAPDYGYAASMAAQQVANVFTAYERESIMADRINAEIYGPPAPVYELIGPPAPPKADPWYYGVGREIRSAVGPAIQARQTSLGREQFQLGPASRLNYGQRGQTVDQLNTYATRDPRVASILQQVGPEQRAALLAFIGRQTGRAGYGGLQGLGDLGEYVPITQPFTHPPEWRAWINANPKQVDRVANMFAAFYASLSAQQEAGTAWMKVSVSDAIDLTQYPPAPGNGGGRQGFVQAFNPSVPSLQAYYFWAMLQVWLHDPKYTWAANWRGQLTWLSKRLRLALNVVWLSEEANRYSEWEAREMQLREKEAKERMEREAKEREAKEKRRKEALELQRREAELEAERRRQEVERQRQRQRDRETKIGTPGVPPPLPPPGAPAGPRVPYPRYPAPAMPPPKKPGISTGMLLAAGGALLLFMRKKR